MQPNVRIPLLHAGTRQEVSLEPNLTVRRRPPAAPCDTERERWHRDAGRAPAVSGASFGRSSPIRRGSYVQVLWRTPARPCPSVRAVQERTGPVSRRPRKRPPGCPATHGFRRGAGPHRKGQGWSDQPSCACATRPYLKTCQACMHAWQVRISRRGIPCGKSVQGTRRTFPQSHQTHLRPLACTAPPDRPASR